MLKIFRSKSRRECNAYHAFQLESLQTALRLGELRDAEIRLEEEMREKLGEEEFAVWKQQREEQKQRAYQEAVIAESLAYEQTKPEIPPQPERRTHQWARAFGSLSKLFGMS